MQRIALAPIATYLKKKKKKKNLGIGEGSP